MSDADHPVNADERRQAPRYPLRTYATLHAADKNWSAHLLDISATGARFAILEDHSLIPGDEVTLIVELQDIAATPFMPPSLQLHGNVVHAREHIIGLSLTIDDSCENENFRRLLTQFSESK